MKTFRTLAPLAVCLALVACGSAEERAAKYLDKAEAAFEAGDYVKAELEVRNSLQIEPNGVEARFLLARLAEAQVIRKPTKWRELFRNLQRVIELDPQHLQARLKLAQVYIGGMRQPGADRAELAVRAREQVDAALAIAPDDPEVRTFDIITRYHEQDIAGDPNAADTALTAAEAVLAGEPGLVAATSFVSSLYAGRDPDKALHYLDEALSINPQSALRVIKIGLLTSLQRYDDAEQEYLALIDAKPEEVQLKYGIADFYAKIGRTEQAQDAYEAVIAADPDNGEARLRLVAFLAEYVGADAAQARLEQFTTEDPDAYQLRFALARLQLQRNDIEAAEAVYTAIVEDDGRGPNGLEARNSLAALRLAQSRLDDARRLIDEVLDTDDGNADALLMQSQLQLRDEDTSAAIASLRTVLRNTTDAETEERALLLLAQAQLSAGSPGLAQESFQQLVSKFPRNAPGRRGLAQLLMRDRQWESARELLSLGVRFHPNDLQMTRLLVDSLIRLEDWDAADVEADRILQIEQTRALGHYLKGRVQQVRGEYEASVESFKAAIELQPSAVEPLTNLVRAYVALEDLDGVYGYLQTFVGDHPDNVHAQTLLAEIEARRGQWDAAVAANQKALEINERWVPAYRNIVGIELEEGDLDAAYAAVQRGLEAVPGHVDLRLLLATIFERYERFDDAIAVYAEELEKNPDLDVAANNYAALIADHRNDPTSLQEALRYAQRFRTSRNPIFLDTLGWVTFRLGEVEDAVELLERAVAGAGEQVPQLRYHLGMAYYEQDRLDIAKRELQAAVDAAGESPFVGVETARETLELL